MNNSILQKLDYDNVLKIKKLDNGNFKFTEQCDGYFCSELTKEEVHQLIVELQEVIK